MQTGELGMIELDDKYSIRVSDYSYDLMRARIARNGKNAGKKQYICEGYYRNIQDALQAYVKMVIRDGLKDKSMNFSEALDEIQNLIGGLINRIDSVVPVVEVRARYRREVK